METTAASILDVAKKYLESGFSVIPLEPRGKRPIIAWKEFQERKPTTEELEAWFGSGESNIGIVTGKISGITVIDCDTREAVDLASGKGLPTCPTAKTGKGYHFYYAYEPGIGNFQKRDDLPGIDLRGEGGFVVAPPSVHETGVVYEWEGESRSLPPLPKWVIADRKPTPGNFRDFYHGAGVGSRNDTLARLSGVWALHLPFSEAMEMALVWNSHNQPPLSIEEVQRTLESIYRKEASKAKIYTSIESNNFSWPEPKKLPEGLLPVPRLEGGMLPEPLRLWLSDIADRFQCPLEFPAIGAIVALSSVVGRQIGIRPKRHDDWQVVPNLWGCIVGRPGVLKTPALDEALKPIKRLEAESREKFREEEKQAEFNKILRKAEKDALDKKVRKAIEEGRDPLPLRSQLEALDDTEPTAKRYIVNDSTVEKLGELLNQNPRGLLHFRDELTGWLRTLDKEGHESDKAFHLEAWNGTGSYTSDRIGRGTTYVEAACESMLGGIQPGPLGSYLRAALRGGAGDDGLVQRFQLMVWPDIAGAWSNVDRKPNREARNRAFDLFKKLDSINPIEIGAQSDTFQPSVGSVGSCPSIPFLNFDNEAQDFFDGWRKDLEDKLRKNEEHPALEAHLAKYRSLMPSLALLFHLLELIDGKPSKGVSLQAAEMAAAWGDFLEAHARRIYQSVSNGGLASAHSLAAKIRAGKVGSPFSARDIYINDWSDLSTAEDAKQAIEILEEAFWIRGEEIRTGGKPRYQYGINPQIKVKVRLDEVPR